MFCEIAFLELVIKIIEIKILKSSFRIPCLVSHAFSKVLLLILNMYLFNWLLFHVKNLFGGLMERLFTEWLVLDHNF